MEGACEWAALQCTRDARAVALVACSSEARLPGMHATRAMAAGARLLGKGRKRAAEDAEGAGERQARAYRGDAAAVGVSTTVAAAAEMGESRKRGRREDIDVNPTSCRVPQWDSVSRERRRGAEAHSYGGLVRSRFGEAVSTSRRTSFRAHFHGLL